MNDAVSSEPIHPVSRKMQAEMADLRFDMRDLETGMAGEHPGHSIIGISGVNGRLDRMSDRVERIERRLDLTDAH